MLDPAEKLSGYEFTQDPQMYRMIRYNGKLYAVPVVTVGGYNAIFAGEVGRNVEILSPLHKSVVNQFDEFPDAKAYFIEASNENIMTMLYSLVSNVIVAPQYQGEPTNSRKLQQDLIDFIAALLNEEYKSGTHIAQVFLEVQQLVSRCIAESGTPELLYFIAPYFHDGLKSFIDVYLKETPTQSNVVSDEDDMQSFLDMFGGEEESDD